MQKQVSCFNYRVVTMLAYKLDRQWFCLVWKTSCIWQPERLLPSSSYNLTTLRTSVKESSQMHIKVVVLLINASR